VVLFVDHLVTSKGRSESVNAISGALVISLMGFSSRASPVPFIYLDAIGETWNGSRVSAFNLFDPNLR